MFLKTLNYFHFTGHTLIGKRYIKTFISAKNEI